MTTIIWKKPDNTIAVTAILDGSDPAEHAALLQGRGDVPASWVVAATGIQEFPEWKQEDWRFDGDKIIVDLAAAKETTRERLREERKPLLEKLDVDFVRTLERGEPTTEIVAEKERLRNITQQVDALETLAALAALQC